MTDQEFDSTLFAASDEVVERKYFGTEKMRVCRVDFQNRTINGYMPQEIITHIKQAKDESI